MFFKTPVLLLLLVFVVTSCSKENSLSAEKKIFQSSKKQQAQQKSPATHCESLVYDFETGDPVSGKATLLRTDSKVSMTLKVDGLTPGNAYSVWWVIWNKPEECINPYACDVPDYDYADLVEVDALYAGGHVVGGNGKGNFAGSLNENDSSESINDLFDLPKYGLYDARTAEVHLVVRDHGPAIPGEVNDQINFYPGGCNTGDCIDIFYAIFRADCGQ